jgi:hypothetical protein
MGSATARDPKLPNLTKSLVELPRPVLRATTCVVRKPFVWGRRDRRLRVLAVAERREGQLPEGHARRA